MVVKELNLWPGSLQQSLRSFGSNDVIKRLGSEAIKLANNQAHTWVIATKSTQAN